MLKCKGEEDGWEMEENCFEKNNQEADYSDWSEKKSNFNSYDWMNLTDSLGLLFEKIQAEVGE